MVENSNAFLKTIAQYALESVLFEAAAAPKPGLVDRFNNGAHKDMNIFTFISSASSLSYHFFKLAEIGFLSAQEGCESVLPRLRKTGLEAENDMFKATNGINTHKGAIFTMGLLCASAARIACNGQDLNAKNICGEIKKITKGLCKRELEAINKAKKLTKGEKAFIEHGLTGIRGEAESGFETILDVALPELLRLKALNISDNDAVCHTLINIIAHTNDTNIATRLNIEAMNYAKKAAQSFIKNYSPLKSGFLKALTELDNDFTKKNISPGGCADLAAGAWFLYRLKQIF